MRRLFVAVAVAVTAIGPTALAQNYNQTIVFGDSTVDAGWFANAKVAPTVPGNSFDAGVAFAVAHGGNAHFTGPGPNNSQILAGFFGTTANSANTPGGTNYAIGGAFVSSGLAPDTNLTSLLFGFPPNPALPTATGQIANYLSSTGGVANPNALYLISVAGNDIFASEALGLSTAQKTALYTFDETNLAASIAGLEKAGAKYVIISNGYLPPSLNNPTGIADAHLIQGIAQTALANAGVKYIYSDTASMIAYVVANPGQFGLTNVTGNACSAPSGIFCFSPLQLASPNALQTYLFIDGTHMTEAGQIITADYNYSLLTAPSEISFLAETAVKARLSLVSSIQTQIELSQERRGPQGVNAWVTGAINSISMENFHGFPGDPDTLVTGAAGVDFALTPGLTAGVAVSGGSLNSALGTTGYFKQTESSVSLYAAYRTGGIWADAIGTYGHLNYNVNRNVQIGTAILNNSGSTSGNDWSAAIQGGYKFWTNALTHGPIAGFIHQDVSVGGFTETGSVTSLGFGSQTRESDVGQFGYRASYDWAEYQPFVQATWNHEFADTNRSVTASLTTIVAPSYSLPAVILGKDWGEVKAGVTIDAGNGVKLLAVGSADFAQSSATVYGGQIGLNVAF
jgi:outer membrane lipase/esterase